MVHRSLLNNCYERVKRRSNVIPGSREPVFQELAKCFTSSGHVIGNGRTASLPNLSNALTCVAELGRCHAEAGAEAAGKTAAVFETGGIADLAYRHGRRGEQVGGMAKSHPGACKLWGFPIKPQEGLGKVPGR